MVPGRPTRSLLPSTPWQREGPVATPGNEGGDQIPGAPSPRRDVASRMLSCMHSLVSSEARMSSFFLTRSSASIIMLFEACSSSKGIANFPFNVIRGMEVPPEDMRDVERIHRLFLLLDGIPDDNVDPQQAFKDSPSELSALLIFRIVSQEGEKRLKAETLIKKIGKDILRTSETSSVLLLLLQLVQFDLKALERCLCLLIWHLEGRKEDDSTKIVAEFFLRKPLILLEVLVFLCDALLSTSSEGCERRVALKQLDFFLCKCLAPKIVSPHAGSSPPALALIAETTLRTLGRVMANIGQEAEEESSRESVNVFPEGSLNDLLTLTETWSSACIASVPRNHLEDLLPHLMFPLDNLSYFFPSLKERILTVIEALKTKCAEARVPVPASFTMDAPTSLQESIRELMSSAEPGIKAMEMLRTHLKTQGVRKEVDEMMKTGTGRTQLGKFCTKFLATFFSGGESERSSPVVGRIPSLAADILGLLGPLPLPDDALIPDGPSILPPPLEEACVLFLQDITLGRRTTDGQRMLAFRALKGVMGLLPEVAREVSDGALTPFIPSQRPSPDVPPLDLDSAGNRLVVDADVWDPTPMDWSVALCKTLYDCTLVQEPCLPLVSDLALSSSEASGFFLPYLVAAALSSATPLLRALISDGIKRSLTKLCEMMELEKPPSKALKAKAALVLDLEQFLRTRCIKDEEQVSLDLEPMGLARLAFRSGRYHLAVMHLEKGCSKNEAFGQDSAVGDLLWEIALAIGDRDVCRGYISEFNKQNPLSLRQQRILLEDALRDQKGGTSALLGAELFSAVVGNPDSEAETWAEAAWHLSQWDDPGAKFRGDGFHENIWLCLREAAAETPKTWQMEDAEKRLKTIVRGDQPSCCPEAWNTRSMAEIMGQLMVVTELSYIRDLKQGTPLSSLPAALLSPGGFSHSTINAPGGFSHSTINESILSFREANTALSARCIGVKAVCGPGPEYVSTVLQKASMARLSGRVDLAKHEVLALRSQQGFMQQQQLILEADLISSSLTTCTLEIIQIKYSQLRSSTKIHCPF